MPARSLSKAYQNEKLAAWRRHKTALRNAQKYLSPQEFEKCKVFLTEQYSQYRRALSTRHGVRKKKAARPSQPTATQHPTLGGLLQPAGIVIAAATLVALAADKAPPDIHLTMPLPTPLTTDIPLTMALPTPPTTAIPLTHAIQLTTTLPTPPTPAIQLTMTLPTPLTTDIPLTMALPTPPTPAIPLTTAPPKPPTPAIQLTIALPTPLTPDIPLTMALPTPLTTAIPLPPAIPVTIALPTPLTDAIPLPLTMTLPTPPTPAIPLTIALPTQKIYATRNQSVSEVSELRWVTMGVGGIMQGGVGAPRLRRRDRHVVLLAMHNEVSSTFRDSIRVQALLRSTSVTHISTMNLHQTLNCLGHNEVDFSRDRDVYPLLKQNRCPSVVFWDYNFVPGGYVISNYKANLFSGQVPGFFACGAHMVVMPNWVIREPRHSVLDKDIVRWQTQELVDGTLSVGHVTCTQGLAAIAPGVIIKQITLSALESETHHPLVAATMRAQDRLQDSTDDNAKSASWFLNKQYIGEKEAFIIFYDAKKIHDPRRYLRMLTVRR
jgi:hypothetical protein